MVEDNQKILFDYSKLKGKLTEKEITIEKLAEVVGISSVSLSKKLNNKNDFKANEIVTIYNYLGLDEYKKYFFTEKVSI